MHRAQRFRVPWTKDSLLHFHGLTGKCFRLGKLAFVIQNLSKCPHAFQSIWVVDSTYLLQLPEDVPQEFLCLGIPALLVDSKRQIKCNYQRFSNEWPEATITSPCASGKCRSDTSIAPG